MLAGGQFNVVDIVGNLFVVIEPGDRRRCAGGIDQAQVEHVAGVITLGGIEIDGRIIERGDIVHDKGRVVGIIGDGGPFGDRRGFIDEDELVAQRQVFIDGDGELTGNAIALFQGKVFCPIGRLDIALVVGQGQRQLTGDRGKTVVAQVGDRELHRVALGNRAAGERHAAVIIRPLVGHVEAQQVNRFAAGIGLQIKDGGTVGAEIVAHARHEGGDFVEAVVASAPAPVHGKVIVRGIAVHDELVAAAGTVTAVEHRPVVVDLVAEHRAPAFGGEFFAVVKHGGGVVIHIVNHRFRNIIRKGARSGGIVRRLHHHAHIVDQLGNLRAGFRSGAAGIGGLDQAPVVGSGEVVAGDDLIVAFVRLVVIVGQAVFRRGAGPAVVVHHLADGHSHAAGHRTAAVHHRAEVVEGSALSPGRRMEFLDRSIAGDALTGGALPERCAFRGLFAAGIAEIGDLPGVFPEEGTNLFRHAFGHEFSGLREGQDRGGGIIAGHDHKSAAGVVEDIEGGGFPGAGQAVGAIPDEIYVGGAAGSGEERGGQLAGLFGRYVRGHCKKGRQQKYESQCGSFHGLSS